MKPEFVSFKSAEHGEYLYTSGKMLSDSRRYLLTWGGKSDPSTDTDMHWRIEHFGEYVGIKSILRDEWMYSSGTMLEGQRRYALTWKKAGDPESDPSMRWIVKDFGDYVGIKSVYHNEWLYAGSGKLDDDRRYALTFPRGDPADDHDGGPAKRWIKKSLATVITSISWKHIGTLPRNRTSSEEIEVGVTQMNSRKETKGSTFKASFEVGASVSVPAGATAETKASTEAALSRFVETMGSRTLTYKMKSTETWESANYNRRIWGLTMQGVPLADLLCGF